ncbi:DUF547 domain-containing protein [Aquimarina sp. U1-2]|uniref:DUF547 domain-containing protein n=1 Tax=Aquimarina sp. U1-2 TaxID=2823141 RepID=UPI001AECE0F5|nr:DUF547 domain-containing protein [Aquimarina sp. U1-2]MBP2833681.1 DUF547 domain-containing protein [Aquimarina sp. U1-2]
MKNFTILFVALITTTIVIGQNKFDHTNWDQALLLNVSSNGFVDYKGFMQNSYLLYDYFQELSENKPDKSWTKDERMAYWINAYNAYTIKLIIDSYPLKSITDLKKPWDKKFFKIDGEWYSLNDLEHKILRKFNDPRIHFAINCASISCPVVWNRAYTGKNLQKALDRQTRDFINDPARNEITSSKVRVSRIFDWFRKDFRANDSDVIKFINTYSNVKIREDQNLKYKNYDWGLNKVLPTYERYVFD